MKETRCERSVLHFCVFHFDTTKTRKYANDVQQLCAVEFGVVDPCATKCHISELCANEAGTVHLGLFKSDFEQMSSHEVASVNGAATKGHLFQSCFVEEQVDHETATVDE